MVDDGDDDDLSVFLPGLATSRVTLGGSWVLDFHHGSYRPSRQSPTSISRLLRHAEEHSGSILLTPKPQGATTNGQ